MQTAMMGTSISANGVSIHTKWRELLSLIRANLCHVQVAGLQVQVYQVRFHLIGHLDPTDHFALANQTHWRSIQQQNLVGIELSDNNVLLVGRQSHRVGCVLREAAAPRAQPVPRERVEHLDPLVASVGHPDPRGAVNKHTVRDVELGQALSFLPVHPQHFLISGQLDEAVVHPSIAIHDVHLSGLVHKYLRRLVKLKGIYTGACLPRSTQHLENTRTKQLIATELKQKRDREETRIPNHLQQIPRRGILFNTVAIRPAAHICDPHSGGRGTGVS